MIIREAKIEDLKQIQIVRKSFNPKGKVFGQIGG
jgi:hypothetical protein